MSNNNENHKDKKFGLKILSLVMAIMLWLYIVNQGGAATSQNYQQIKLNYYNVPAELAISGPETVSVRIWGITNAPGNVIAYVDLTGLQQGTYKLPVKVKPLQGVMFATVQPDKVDIELKSPADRNLNIGYELAQSLPDGVELREVIISPPKCIVRGEQEAVSKVASVYARINIGEEKGIISQQSTLVARDAQGNKINSGIQLVPAAVNVYAVAENKKVTKELAVRLKLKGKAADGYELGTIISDPAKVSVLGEESILAGMEEISTQEIDLSDRKESFTQTVALQVPEGMIISPSQVTVVVSIASADNEAEQ
jgi:YbbR domain-containing protein